MTLIPPSPRCKRCGAYLIDGKCPMSICGWKETRSGIKCLRCEKEREVRRRLREWLQFERASGDWPPESASILEDVEAKLRMLERELLGEEK